MSTKRTTAVALLLFSFLSASGCAQALQVWDSLLIDLKLKHEPATVPGDTTTETDDGRDETGG